MYVKVHLLLLCKKNRAMVRYLLIAVNIILLMLVAINALLKDFFSNTFQIGELMAFLSVIGVASGLSFAFLYIRNSGTSERIAQVQIALTALVMSVLFFVVAGVNLNYLLAKKHDFTSQYLIMDIRPFFKSGGGILRGENVVPNGYVVYIEKDGKTAEVRFKNIENYKILIGKTVALDIRLGLLGYEVFVPKPIVEN